MNFISQSVTKPIKKYKLRKIPSISPGSYLTLVKSTSLAGNITILVFPIFTQTIYQTSDAHSKVQFELLNLELEMLTIDESEKLEGRKLEIGRAHV